jgi:cytoskeletal protein RodZ
MHGLFPYSCRAWQDVFWCPSYKGQSNRPEGATMLEIGLALRNGRLARGLEIGDIARSTCISARYLKAMEEGKFQSIPTVFDKGYLKLYANALAMDAKHLLALYEQMKNTAAAPAAAPETDGNH